MGAQTRPATFSDLNGRIVIPIRISYQVGYNPLITFSSFWRLSSQTSSKKKNPPGPVQSQWIIAFSVRLIIVQARRALVGTQSEVVFICTVTGLRLKYTGLRIVYVPFCHVPLMMQSRVMAILRSRTRRTEVDARTSTEIWKMVNYSKKG